MYLENIFIGSEDIRKQLPQESIMFDSVHATFMAQMQQLNIAHNVVKVGPFASTPYSIVCQDQLAVPTQNATSNHGLNPSWMHGAGT